MNVHPYQIFPHEIWELIIKYVSTPINNNYKQVCKSRQNLRKTCKTLNMITGCQCFDIHPHEGSLFACEKGHTVCLEKMINQGLKLVKMNYILAVKHNRFEIIKILQEWKCPNDHCVTAVAAASGNLNMLKYLHSSGILCNEYTSGMAARNNKLDCFEFLVSVGCPVDERAAAWTAIEGHLDMVEYLYENGYPANPLIYNLSVTYGYSNIIGWLRDHQDWYT